MSASRSRLGERKFRVLLLALILLLAAYPLLHGAFGARLVFDLVLTLVFAVSFEVAFTGWRLRTPALLLGLITLLGAWTGYVVGDTHRQLFAVGFHLCSAVFLVGTVAAILRLVYRDVIVSADSVCGALCGYLLIGLAFSHVYCLIADLRLDGFSGTAAVATQLHDEAGRHFLLTYFSFATLTTVGYGDITPTSNVTRGLAVVESILGQFYIAVLIAELVGKRGSLASHAQPSGPTESPS